MNWYEEFSKEYNVKWINENDELLKVIALRYEYRCEMYDRCWCGNYKEDRNGFIMFNNPIASKNSQRNAIEERKIVRRFLYLIDSTWDDYRNIKKSVDRMTWQGIQLEYEAVLQDIWDKIKEIESVR